MERTYCKYCAKYVTAAFYLINKHRCVRCQIRSKAGADAENEVEQVFKTLTKCKNPTKKYRKISPTLLAKRQQHEEKLDMEAIEREYAL